MARKTKQEADATRNNILNAALDIIYEKGYARSTFVDIANQINLTKGAVYWHFKSKPDMFLALSRLLEDKIENELANIQDDACSLSDLKRMLYEMILLIAENPQLRKYYTIVFFRMEWTEELLPIKQFFNDQDQSMMTWIAEILRHAQSAGEISKGKDIHILSRTMIELTNGLLSYSLSGDEEFNARTPLVVETGLDTFFAGMQADDNLLNKGCTA